MAKNPFVVGLQADKKTIHIEEDVSLLTVDQAGQLIADLSNILAQAKGGQDALDEALKQVSKPQPQQG